MRFLSIVVAMAALAGAVDAAYAHPGHLAENGHGHSHWIALIALGGLAVLAAGALAFRLVKGRLPFVYARAADK
jgi:hypothetical protein